MNKRIIGAVFGIVVGVIILLLPIQNITREAQIQLALTLVAVIFWATDVVQNGYVSGIYCALLIILNVAPAGTVFSVWLGPTLWLVIASFLIAGAVNQSGLAKRLAYPFIIKFVNGYKSMIVSVMALQILLSLFIPNGFARCFLILSVMREVIACAKIEKRDAIFVYFSIFAFACPTSMIFLTGESAINVMALAFSGVELGWMSWFIYMGIPNLIASAIFLWLFLVLFKPSTPVTIDKDAIKENQKRLGPLKASEKKMAVWLFIFIVFWLTDSIHGINISWGTLLITMLMSLPIIGDLTTRKTWSEIPLNMLFFLTGALTIGTVGNVTGMNEFIAQTILPSSFNTNIYLIALFITFLTVVLHMVLGSVVAVMAVAIPTMLAFIPAIGADISPVVIGLMVYEAITLHFIFPYHGLPIAVGQDAAGYTNKEVMRMGIPLTLVVFFITLLIQVPWWSLVGLI